ncbi:MAG TPA: PAS domain S-box protein, partial [Sideroxyarcus sp.]|nr:PAS domain S-box protein [Sideroxyarcus sp.]
MRVRVGLSATITIAALLLLVAGTLLWIDKENERLHETYLSERRGDLGAALHIEKVRLSQAVETLRQDTVFLALTPPVSGMVRASANKGIDPRDKDSYATWEGRLQEIFAAFLRVHPDYLQVRFIAAADDGRELVRVDNRDGRVAVIPHEALQPQGDQDYFRAGLMLTAGRVHLSEFALDRQRGRIEEPHRPTLGAVTPVFDANGRVFGMVVINKDVSAQFASSSAGLPPGILGYIADQQGHYLFHPDARRAFAFESGDNGNITDDFQTLKPMFDPQAQSYLPLHATDDRDGVQYLAAERVFFDASDPSRFLLLVYHIPADVAAGQAAHISKSLIVNTLLLMFVAGVALTLMLRRTFSPLRRITAAAREIAAGNRNIRLGRSGGGEVGELTEALNTMLDKLSDSDLVARENRFRKELIESLPGVFYMFDRQGYFLMWNHNLERVVQRSPEELASSHPLDFFESEDRANIESTIRQVFEEGEASVEAVLVAKDGTKTPYHFTGRRVARNGEPVLIGMGLDITERRKMHAVLQRHQRVIETAMDGFWMADEHGFLEEVNEAYAKMSGYAMQDLVGMHISQLEANEQAEGVEAHIDRIMAQGYDRFETRHRRKDGRVVDIEMAATFMPETGELFAFSHNITQRKQAEQALRIAAATFETNEAILITDAQANIIRVNRAFTEVTGFTAEDVIGKNPRIMSSGRHDDAFYTAMWQQLLETGSWAGEIWDRRKNGEIFPKWMTITAVKDAHGEIAQYVAIFSDITARKLDEEAIRNLAFYDALTQLPNRRL